MNRITRILVGALSAIAMPFAYGDVDIARLMSEVSAADENLRQLEQRSQHISTEESRSQLANAQKAARHANDQLEQARIAALTENVNVSRDSIVRARADGKSWLTITAQYNLHPSVVGIELIDASPPPLALPPP